MRVAKRTASLQNQNNGFVAGHRVRVRVRIRVRVRV